MTVNWNGDWKFNSPEKVAKEIKELYGEDATTFMLCTPAEFFPYELRQHLRMFQNLEEIVHGIFRDAGVKRI